jgi:hypothetical protein
MGGIPIQVFNFLNKSVGFLIIENAGTVSDKS